MSTMEITFPGGDRVDARYGDRTVSTDQEGSLPRPFDLFLASIATCSGYYVARFCRERGIPLEGVRLRQRTVSNPDTRMIERIELDLDLPRDFPERYRKAVVRAAGLCTVKKHLEHPPEVEVRIGEGVGA